MFRIDETFLKSAIFRRVRSRFLPYINIVFSIYWYKFGKEAKANAGARHVSAPTAASRPSKKKNDANEGGDATTAEG